MAAGRLANKARRWANDCMEHSLDPYRLGSSPNLGQLSFILCELADEIERVTTKFETFEADIRKLKEELQREKYQHLVTATGRDALDMD